MLSEKNKETALFYDQSTLRVAEALFRYPGRTFHLRELAEETGLSTTAVTSGVKRLVRLTIAAVNETPATKDIAANRESPAYAQYKRLFNLYRVLRYGLLDLLVEQFQPRAIVLFGSFAKGEDTEESDIDICVISNRKPDIALAGKLAVYEDDFKRKIDLHVLQTPQKSDPAFKNALANGIVLEGYLELV